MSHLPGTKIIPQAFMLEVSTSGERLPLDRDELILGSGPDCDLCLNEPTAAPCHARFVRRNNSFEVQTLDSEAGLWIAGKPISQQLLRHGDRITLSPQLSLTFLVVAPLQSPEQILPLNFGDRNAFTLGRDAHNDMVIDHLTVSAFHARIDRQDNGWTITDLDSSNGTFINGEKIIGQRPLHVGDTIQIGPHRLDFNPDGTLLFANEAGNLSLNALHLVKTIPRGFPLLQRSRVRLLNNISLSIQPREFVAIVGSSGAGKSTLLDALSGFRPAEEGEVLVNQHDLYTNFNAYRTAIGYVPQDDIIHQELTVTQALDYAARLRLPADTTVQERRQRVNDVLIDLELTHRRHVLVKNLSGGQRKRVSIGVELLTKPSLFFLDEATSGLDPGTEFQMMNLLRKLANQGRTILLITHATKNVMMCDQVVFLAKGGRVAFFGPPAEALDYFEVEDFDQIYLKVEQGAQEWQERYSQSPQYQKYILERQRDLPVDLPGKQHPRPVQPPAATQSKGVPAWRQFLILTQRNLTILFQDRVSLALMLALAPLLGVLDFVMWKRDLFDPQRGDAGQSFTMAFVSVLIAVIVGSLATMRELVKEAEIYRRERMVGLKIFPYIFSKVGLAIVLALYQAAIFLLTKLLSVQITTSLWTIAALYLTLLLSTLGGMIMGLLVSAFSPSQNVAPLLTILVLVPQITFAGAIIPLNTFGGAGQLISSLTITRWAFGAMVTLTEVGQDVAQDPCWQLSEPTRKALTEAQKQSCQCLGPQIFSRCNFPGIKREYVPAVDQPEPPRPQAPGDPPALPDNPFDSDYRDQVEAYSDRAKTYDRAMRTWQDQFTDWKEKRGTAIATAEALIKRFHDTQGNNFAVPVPLYWGIMAGIMTVMLAALLLIQKWKDIL
uniref:FHA modulated ABC efflux pump with fused ATPase and integral membrane subunits n=1 Tax=Cyanothece sp. (strain PCC 7425 / ATCC 29141) TaxID=395961 RepID=B8HVR2_CYAP4